MIFCNAFLREPQRYGADIVKGFDGLVRYQSAHTGGRFRFVVAGLHRDAGHSHDDGYVLIESVQDGA